MEKLKTPFGEISILVDGKSIEYVALEGEENDVLWPDIKGRYQIKIRYIPDGKEHYLACVFSPICSYERGPESGERLTCQAFYNSQRIKMSIGLEQEDDYWGGPGIPSWYDYGAEYLENGMTYVIEPETKTEEYVFGIAWIDEVDLDDPRESGSRDVQTWYAADPRYFLIGKSITRN